jgi:hypothetical protein
MGESIEIGDITISVTRKDVKNVHLSVHPPDGRAHTRSQELDGSGSSKSSFARRRGKPHVHSSVARPTTFGDDAIFSV